MHIKIPIKWAGGRVKGRGTEEEEEEEEERRRRRKGGQDTTEGLQLKYYSIIKTSHLAFRLLKAQ
jgi:hypothetical protein